MRAKVFAISMNYGFNTGRLRLHGNEWARQKNPFFSPMLSMRMGITLFKKMVLTVRGDYEYDISSPNWRRTYFADKNKIDLEKYIQTGLTLFFCVGFYFVDRFGE